MSSGRRRPRSPLWDGRVGRSRDGTASEDANEVTRGLRGLVEKAPGTQPDPTNPVLNGPSAATDKPWLKGLLADLATQLPRANADIGLVASIFNSKIFDGGLVNDRTYQVNCARLVLQSSNVL